MNNIRKIIAEKIADKKDKRVNDYADGFNDGLIQAFKIFLEEIPAPRTEQEILNDFEKLGYKVKKNFSHIILLHENGDEIKIWFNDKTYSSSIGINMQEHKLLNELFEVIF